MGDPTTDALKSLREKYGNLFGEEEEEAKPPSTAQRINIIQDFAKLLADTRGVDEAFAYEFLRKNPDIESALITDFDLANREGRTRFAKMMFDLEEAGALGTNLGQKAGSLTQSITTRTLSPSEAESIFKLESEWNLAQKQAPLEAAKFLSKGYTPESFAGAFMPGFEEGGIYRQLLPGVNPQQFAYQPSGPGAIEAIAQLFRPDENESMQMARMALQRALQTGISSTSQTTSTTTPIGGSAAQAPPSPSSLVEAYFGAFPQAQYQPPTPSFEEFNQGESPSIQQPSMLFPQTAPQPQPNILQRIFGGLFSR